MSQVDRFAQIAFEDYAQGKEKLQGDTPIIYEKKYFDSTEKVVPAICKEEYTQSLDNFKKDMQALREKYRPFMEDYKPQLNETRKNWIQDTFQFRYETEQDREDFNVVLDGNGEWEQVSLPDYRGPIGRWTGFYRREFVHHRERNAQKGVYIQFLGVDYIGKVYLNGRHIGSHEGFFAPFELEVTPHIRYRKKNILVIEVENDAPTLGLGSWDESQDLDGDKIYAATGLGWDDPKLGWHHSPPGAGIYNKVIIEERSTLFIKDIFVRPDIDTSSAEVWIEIENARYENRKFDMKISLFSKNFTGIEIKDMPCIVMPAGPGVNTYRLKVDLQGMRLWTPEAPWLYKARVAVYDGEALLDERDQQFGMRKFKMDEESAQKGSLYLNNQPIILRGANDMGHMQLCVLKDDMDQLVDDILIARNANMNYYRFTQRPVQKEIYEYCDMLGMMNQTDLPLFGYLRRNQFVEGIRQAGEMERLIRSHPSSIMVTYINEPFSALEKDKAHRDLYRNELEDFFEGATKVVRLYNPDRVIKNVEGDYDPPTRWGLSDFHCYNMWYTNHALPIGKLHKGYLPPLKGGWKSGCGEYSGGEGLDPLELMIASYPNDWLPGNFKAPWTPESIIRSQSYSMHGDWYEEQTTIEEWIRESHRHQCEGTRLMTDALRRRSDRILSTAIHLLIDAWPSGWMKTLVDCTRTPKPAYFEFKKCLVPVRVNLRTDKFRLYSGETGEVEAWILNDTHKSLIGYTIQATLRDESRDYGSYQSKVDAQPVCPTYAGTIKVALPLVDDRRWIYLDAALLDDKGNIVNQERMLLEVFARRQKRICRSVMYLGKTQNSIIKALEIQPIQYDRDGERPNVLLIDAIDDFYGEQNTVLAWLKDGTRLILAGDEIKEGITIGDMDIAIKEMNGLTFVARNQNHELTRSFGPRDFSYPYNKNTDEIDFIATRYLDSDELIPLVYTYQKPGFFESAKGEKRKLPVAGYMHYGKGQIMISLLPTDGFIGCNPVLDQFYINLIEEGHHG